MKNTDNNVQNRHSDEEQKSWIDPTIDADFDDKNEHQSHDKGVDQAKHFCEGQLDVGVLVESAENRVNDDWADDEGVRPDCREGLAYGHVESFGDHHN